jgi:hypothetical protein
MKYTRANTTNGSSWDAPVQLEPAGVNGRASLLVVSGQPAIAYSKLGGLNYVRASTSDGSIWGTPTVVDVDGVQPYMVLANGQPAIAFSSFSGLRYVRATDATGTVWGLAQTLDPVTVATTVMETIAGYPTVAYFENGADNLRFIQAIDVDGTAWNPSVILDSDGNVGNNPSLAELDGKAGISYLDNTAATLRFMRQE